jgi:hypothetical protein
VHGAAGGEVAAGPLVGDAGQRLEAHDVVGAERLRLRAGEAHGELGVIGDAVGLRHPRGLSQRLGDAPGAKPAAQKADALAGQLEQIPDIGAAVLVLEQRLSCV